MHPALKIALVTLPLTLVGAGILAVVVRSGPPPAQIEPTERAIAVRMVQITPQSITPHVSGFGLVQPAHVYEAIPQVSGIVEIVNPDLKKGQILPAGAQLLGLAPADFTLAVAQSRANIRAAQARLDEISVSEANQKAALAIEHATLQLREQELARAETLLAGGTMSQSKRDAAQSALLAQRQKVQSVENALALLPTQREIQREQIAASQISLELAELNLQRTKLTLPFAARVASATLEVGEYARAGAAVAVLDGIDTAEIEAQIAVTQLRDLMLQAVPADATMPLDPSTMSDMLGQLGLSAKVRLHLGQDIVEWPATLDRLSDTIDTRTGALGVIVQVADAYGGATPGQRPPLTKGMFVEVILSGPPIDGLVVPRNAIRDGKILSIGNENRLVQTPVDTLYEQGEFAVLQATTDTPHQIVVSKPIPLMPGMLLNPVIDQALQHQLDKIGTDK